jgi:hypothetical protein
VKAQRVQIAQALLRIAADITAKDRTECAKKLNISKITICYYLGGKITNNDRALKVLEFFKSRIAARQQEIDNLCKKD